MSPQTAFHNGIRHTRHTNAGVTRPFCTIDRRYNPLAETMARLEWAHGPERAQAIEAGRDARTIADLAAWKALGGSHEAQGAKR